MRWLCLQRNQHSSLCPAIRSNCRSSRVCTQIIHREKRSRSSTEVRSAQGLTHSHWRGTFSFVHESDMLKFAYIYRSSSGYGELRNPKVPSIYKKSCLILTVTTRSPATKPLVVYGKAILSIRLAQALHLLAPSTETLEIAPGIGFGIESILLHSAGVLNESKGEPRRNPQAANQVFFHFLSFTTFYFISYVPIFFPVLLFNDQTPFRCLYPSLLWLFRTWPTHPHTISFRLHANHMTFFEMYIREKTAHIDFPYE